MHPQNEEINNNKEEEKQIIQRKPFVWQYTSIDREIIRHLGYQSYVSMFERLKFDRDCDPNQLGLTDDELKIWQQNPHIRQLLVNHPIIKAESLENFVKNRKITNSNNLNPLDTSLLIPDFHQKRRIIDYMCDHKMDYFKQPDKSLKTTDHWGQRKLFMSELEFLTNYADEGSIIVYAGT